MSSFNEITVVGRLTRDPELKQTSGGHSVANFGLAVNRGFSKDAAVDFFNVAAWRNLGEAVAAHKSKGDLVLVKGPMQNNPYEKDGVKRDSWTIVARDVVYLSSPSQGGNSNTSVDDDDDDEIPF